MFMLSANADPILEKLDSSHAASKLCIGQSSFCQLLYELDRQLLNKQRVSLNTTESLLGDNRNRLDLNE